MSPLIVVQFLGLLLSKMTGGLLPTSFLLFSLVGGTGVFVHMAVLVVMHEIFHLPLTTGVVIAALVSMTTNFLLNNTLTYADKKLRGRRFWIGLLTFYAVCAFGLIANLSVASWIYRIDAHQFYVAGIIGVVMSVVFNYAVTRVFTWR